RGAFKGGLEIDGSQCGGDRELSRAAPEMTAINNLDPHEQSVQEANLAGMFHLKGLGNRRVAVIPDQPALAGGFEDAQSSRAWQIVNPLCRPVSPRYLRARACISSRVQFNLTPVQSTRQHTTGRVSGSHRGASIDERLCQLECFPPSSIAIGTPLIHPKQGIKRSRASPAAPTDQVHAHNFHSTSVWMDCDPRSLALPGIARPIRLA
ncbi:hypothetical protein M747DRAFT_247892, partial [Aspergillus niger ATCC 13496]